MTPSSRWLSEINLTYPSLTLQHLASWHSLEADDPNPGGTIRAAAERFLPTGYTSVHLQKHLGS